jgi:hypothetical protein
MVHKMYSTLGAALILSIGALPVCAQQPDDPGSEDHPVVKHYPGAFIDGYEVREPDEFRLPLDTSPWNDEYVHSVTRYVAPAANNDTPDGWAKSRRAELVKGT